MGKIIVTGGAGFIGSGVVAALNKQGRDDIFIVDHLGKSDKWKNLVGLSYEDYFEKDSFLETITSDPQFLKDQGVEAVIHLGACSSTTEEDLDYLIYNNTYYSKVLCMNALENGARFVYASSAATYGMGEHGFKDGFEGIEKLRPLNRYGYSKQLFDLWVKKQNLTDKVAGLKFFNVFGPNEYHKLSMQSMVRKAYLQIKESDSVKLFKSHTSNYADGDQMRDFVYIKDVVDIVLWFLENPDKNGLFNLGSGKARSWNDLMKAVFAAMDLSPAIQYVDMPDNLKNQYQDFTEADMSSVVKAGYPKELRTLESSVAEYVREYLSRDQYLVAENY